MMTEDRRCAKLLLSALRDDLHIPQSRLETDSSYQIRLLYSALASWFSSALWETEDRIIPETNERPVAQTGVSRVQLMSRVQDKRKAYEQLFPCFASLSHASTDLCKTLYNTLLRAGWLYAYPHRCRPAPEARAIAYGIEWIRAPYPNTRHAMSGAGVYERAASEGMPDALDAMLCLNKITPSMLLDRLSYGSGWTSPDGMNELTPITPTRKGYSVKFRRTEGAREYWLIQGMRGRRFEDWEKREGFHLMAALAIGTPVARIAGDEALTEITLTNALPTQERAFFDLYSWVNDNDVERKRNQYRIARVLLPAAKAILCRMNFRIEEQSL